ncbi:MarR family winged helix-turn-helix transcriptional regulator [Streptomyces sp. NPDC006923]|uniref:MarR family winged helix-turn-helix transcriptional regulator n=1 Tax=Streptomyces sp. NPDC006923 TaxID=3155355 RepID=UPI0033DF37B0
MHPGSVDAMKAPRTTSTVISQAEQDGWYGLLYAQAAMRTRIEAVLMERHRLSFSAFEILCRLKDCEPQPVRVLASELVTVSPTRASRLVQDLIDGGYLVRGASQGDGRISLISLTEEGHRYIQTVARTFEESVKTFFADALDADDVAALTRIWQKLEAGADVPDGRRNTMP